MGSNSKEATVQQIPKIDFTDVDPQNPGSEAWKTVRSQVFEALDSLGCFEAIYDKVSPSLVDHLFGAALNDLFALPLETKKRNVSPTNLQGYVGQVPGWPFESLGVNNAPLLEASKGFTDIMWPDGNPKFCETVWAFAKQMQELEQMVRRMALEALGVEKHFDSYIESTYSSVRFMEYGVPLDGVASNGMKAHTDMNVISIICQHQLGGLELQTKDGEWIAIVPSPNSFAVMTGEAFQAWTNGRIKPAYHRVDVNCRKKRYSVGFGTSPKIGYLVQSPVELVDGDHPLLYKPYDYTEYMRFRFSEAGEKAENALEAYCGVGGQEKDSC